MCELVKLLFIISVVCSKFYTVSRNFTRPPVPPVPTNMMSDVVIMIMPPTGAPGHPGCGLAVEAAVVQSVPEEDVDLDLDKYCNGDYGVGNDGGADQCKGTTGC